MNKESIKPINMLNYYAQGAFPMADENGKIDWYQPKTRTIIPLDNYNIPRSLKKFMENSEYQFKYDKNVMEVVEQCAKRKQTWISPELVEAYRGIHEIGFLHSVEVYQNDKLVGGLYGVIIGGAFFGESMFSKKSQASKSALVKLLARLSKKGFVVLDIQFLTPHLEMFGAVEIDFEEYALLLEKAYSKDVRFI